MTLKARQGWIGKGEVNMADARITSRNIQLREQAPSDADTSDYYLKAHQRASGYGFRGDQRQQLMSALKNQRSLVQPEHRFCLSSCFRRWNIYRR
ncbi:MAG: hypothetical protein MZV63_13920 [Marinilabiliales bacterium]|nr:hypothetical protein [Marinilabiliales bacterium]